MTIQKEQPKPHISISSWSLHRSLGRPSSYGVADGKMIPTHTHNRGKLSLLELPEAIAKFGIHTLELCHFHLPSLDVGYLNEFKGALADADVTLFSFLVDNGDITHPQTGLVDTAWVESWAEVAATLGSQHMRVIAGKQENTAANLQLSGQRLKRLADAAAVYGIRLMIENWFPLLSTPESLITLLDSLDRRVGLCFDFGNWSGEEKYKNLAQIAPYAESCHAKAYFNEAGQIDSQDYAKCIEILSAVNFQGPFTLIFDSPQPDEWTGLAVEREMILSAQSRLNLGTI